MTAEFPDLPSFKFCSRSTRRAASDIEERIYKGINAVTGLKNMKKFLKDVAKWISDRPVVLGGEVSKSGYAFSPDDNQECIDEFLNVEQIYLDYKILGNRVEMEFAMLYNDILINKGKNLPTYLNSTKSSIHLLITFDLHPF